MCTMKKIALGIMALAAGVFGFGVVAQAQYTPGGEVVGGGTVSPGAPFTVVFENCPVGVMITISQAQSTPPSLTVECLPVTSPALTGSIVGLLLPQQTGLGTATATFTSGPTTPGDYVVTASGPGYSASLAITVPGQVGTTTTVAAPGTTATPGGTPGGVIPSTGGDGMGTTATIALSLFVVGAGLLIVATVRRRQPHATA